MRGLDALQQRGFSLAFIQLFTSLYQVLAEAEWRVTNNTYVL